jgi:hypothetical protein
MARRPPAELDKFMKNLPKGDYHRITFVNKDDPRRLCYFSVSKIISAEKRGRLTEGIPQARVFAASTFHLGREDFHAAVEAAGELVEQRLGRNASASHSVLFPRKLIDHDEWSDRLQEPPAHIPKGGIEVLLDDWVFKKLEEQNIRESFLTRYLKTLSYVGGRKDEATYERQMSYGEKSKKRYPGFSAYQLFYAANQHFRPLMQELAEAQSKSKVKQLLQEHMDARGLFAEEYATRIWRIICPHRDSARRIAEDSREKSENLTL